MTFGKKDDKDSEIAGAGTGASVHPLRSAERGKVEAFLGKGAKVVGSLTFSGPVEVDGYIEGEINAQDKLTIGESAVVNAKITGTEVLIMGTLNGDVTASTRLSLKKPAKVTGNLHCSNLSIEEGVSFEGKCSMSTASRSASTKPQSTEKVGVPA